MKKLSGAIIKKELSALLGDTLKEHGFHKLRDGHYENAVPGVQRLVGFASVFARGTHYITLGVRVRFPAVEAILHFNKDDPHLSGTYGGRVDTFIANSEGEWACRDVTDLPAIAEEMKSSIENSIPFLFENSTLSAVRQRLISNLPPMCDSVVKICILSCMDVVDGNVSGGLERLDKHVAENRAKQPSQWLWPKELRDYIASLQCT